ncbi:MAG: signal peptide peptidase SppA [Alphaproteobacteria bacterium]
MRKFFRLFFWAFALIGFSVVALMVVGGYFAFNYKQHSGFAELPDEIVLGIDLNQPILEKPDNSLFGDSEGILVRDIVMALDRARIDPRVKGVIARMGAYPLGFGQAQEIAEAVRAVRQSGKFTLVHSDDLGSSWNGTVDYIAAAAFENIWLQRTGGLGLTGLALEMPYARKAMEEISVTAEFEQRHEFKGGADPFTRSSMPLPVRRNMTQLLTSWATLLEEELVKSGRIEAGELYSVFDNGPYLAEDARSLGLVDGEGYWDEAKAYVSVMTSETAELVEPVDYLAAELNDVPGDAPGIALIYGVGPIVWDDGDGSLFGSETFNPVAVSEALADAREDDSIDAVVLRIVSPGGGYAPSDEVWRQVRMLKQANKPVIVSMGDIAASGGYFIAMDGNRVFAPGGSITGSIGVYSGKFATEALWNRLGVNWEGVSIGRNAMMWSEIEPLTETGRQKFSEGVDFVYEDFTSKVRNARGMTENQIDSVARGRIWTGRDALGAGLVDEEGGLLDAIAFARTSAGIAPDQQVRFVDMPKPKDSWEQVMELIEGGDPFGVLSARLVQRWLTSGRGRPALSLAERLTLLQPAGQLHTPPFRLAR